MRKILLFFVVVSALLLYACSNQEPIGQAAQNDAPSDAPGQGFPGERMNQGDFMENIFAACEGMSDGDTCTIESPMGVSEGTCQDFNGSLGCRTQRQFNGTGNGFFQEGNREDFMKVLAFACEGKSEGDQCLAESSRGESAGTCRYMEDNLICRTDFQRGLQ